MFTHTGALSRLNFSVCEITCLLSVLSNTCRRATYKCKWAKKKNKACFFLFSVSLLLFALHWLSGCVVWKEHCTIKSFHGPLVQKFSLFHGSFCHWNRIYLLHPVPHVFSSPFNLQIKRSWTFRCTFLLFEPLWRKPLDGFPWAGGVGSNNGMSLAICYFCLFVPQSHRGFAARVSALQRPTRRPCLFYVWDEVSSPLWWMSVAWERPNCPVQQRVVIPAWPPAWRAHSHSGPLAHRLQNNALLPCLFTGPLWAVPWGCTAPW